MEDLAAALIWITLIIGVVVVKLARMHYEYKDKNHPK